MRSILVSLCLFCSLSFSGFAGAAPVDADAVDSADVVAAAAVVDTTPADEGSDTVVFPETDVTSEGEIQIAPVVVDGDVTACDSDVMSCGDVVVVGSDVDGTVIELPVTVVVPAAVAAPPVAQPTVPASSTGGTLPLIGAFVAALIALLRRYAHLDSVVPPVLLPLLAAALATATGTVWGVVFAKLPVSLTLIGNSALGGLLATGLYEILKNFTKKTEAGLPANSSVAPS